MSIVSGSPPSAPASMGGLSSAVEDVSTGMSSLRFDGDSYLSRNPATAGNRKTWTFSAWVKWSALHRGTIFHQYDGVAGNRCWFVIQDDFIFQANAGGSGSSINKIITSSLYRDPSAWYHFLIANDTTQSTSTDRIKLWVNGVEILTNKTPANQNMDGLCNSANLMEIGHLAGGYFKGYLANIHFIDGEALSPEATGELVSDVWRPKKYSGDYGVNGFHLDFHPDNMVYDVNGQLTTVMDTSGNDNHWTAH